MTTPKPVIIGAEGQIGKMLCHYLKTRLNNYIGLSRQELDLTDYKKINETLKNIDFDVLINCAGYTNTENAELFPEQAFEINQDSVAHLVEVCNQKNKPIIHISTNCVFDGTQNSPYTEEDIPNPQSIYGSSKYAGEKIIQEYAKKFIILRTSWVFSQHPGHNFVLKILNIAKQQGFLKIVNDQFGRPTSALSNAELLSLLAAKISQEQLTSGIYHYGSTTPVSWFEFTEKIFNIAHKLGLSKAINIEPVKTGMVPTRVNRPKNGVLDCTKIQRMLNIKLPDWEQDLEYTLAMLQRSTKNEQ